MAKKPIILISWGPCADLEHMSQGMMLTKAYAWAVSANGGIPMIPLDYTCIDEYVEKCDGLIFPGAMNFKSRPGIPQNFSMEGSSRRDDFDKKIFKAFCDAGKPVMGICEGLQIINCACEGGSLYLDLMQTSGVNHMATAHKITTEPGSKIHELWGDNPTINSYHNFHVKDLGKGLKITSRSPEGNVESVEGIDLPIYAYQFHPERMRGDNIFPAEGADGDLVFTDFINKCAEIRDSKN